MKQFTAIKHFFNRERLLPALTFFALLALMVIQVGYIHKAAELEEQNFNHRAVMALKDTRDEMARRIPACNDMQNYLSMAQCAETAKRRSATEVDSILRSKLAFYRIDMAYTFQITDSLIMPFEKVAFASTCYQQTLNGLLNKNGIQMRLRFPDRNQFVLKQVGGIFVLSILFIGFVMVSYVLSQRMFSKVKTQMNQTQEFINNMVHEFQTPLANIRFASNLIKKRVEKDGLDGKLKEYTKIIQDENQKMEAHVVDILKVACSERSHEEEEIQLHELIGQVVESYGFSIEKKQAQLTLSLRAENDSIQGDKAELERVVSNLLDNALKYANGKPKIEIATANETNLLLFQITDHGVGINNADLPKIFDRYYRVSTGDVHNVKGFGLGLTYVKKIVEKYGGKISVNSKLNQHTTFSIRMPLFF